MKLFRHLKSFKSDDSAALSLDWPALTAAVLGLSHVAMTVIGAGITGLGDAIVVERGRRKPG